MSGLEALAALGLTCNIFQTISFGRKIIALAKHVYRNRSLDDAMYTYAGELRDVAANIQAAISKDPSTKALSSQDNQILEMSRKYSTAARELQDEVEFLGINAQRGSLLATTKVASTANWRKRRLDRIERELRQTERNLQTGLLGQICTLVNTTRHQIESIDEKLEDFLQRYNQGSRNSSEHIQRESLQTRKYVTKGSANIRQAISNVTHEVIRSEERVSKGVVTGIASLKTNEASRVHRERLLASLKYSGMNERRNQVGDSFPDTFDWIFATKGDHSRPDIPDDRTFSRKSTIT